MLLSARPQLSRPENPKFHDRHALPAHATERIALHVKVSYTASLLRYPALDQSHMFFILAGNDEMDRRDPAPQPCRIGPGRRAGAAARWARRSCLGCPWSLARALGKGQ